VLPCVGCWISGKDGAAATDDEDRGSVAVEAVAKMGIDVEQGG